MPVYLWLALIAAVGYSLNSLFIKQALAEGCDRRWLPPAMLAPPGILLLPAVFLGGPWPAPTALWQPLLASFFFLSGTLLTQNALRGGDVSLVGPLMGLKPVITALLLASLLRQPPPPVTWVAAALCALALFVMRTPNVMNSSSFLKTLLLSAGASTSFSLCDLTFQRFAASWPVMRFTAIAFLLAFGWSLFLVPSIPSRWRDIPRLARRHTIIAALCIMITVVCMAFAIGRYGHAAEVNVMYSSRALWTIVIVWLLGRHIGNREHTGGRSILIRRTAGAALLIASIVLVVAFS